MDPRSAPDLGDCTSIPRNRRVHARPFGCRARSRRPGARVRCRWRGARRPRAEWRAGRPVPRSHRSRSIGRRTGAGPSSTTTRPGTHRSRTTTPSPAVARSSSPCTRSRPAREGTDDATAAYWYARVDDRACAGRGLTRRGRGALRRRRHHDRRRDLGRLLPGVSRRADLGLPFAQRLVAQLSVLRLRPPVPRRPWPRVERVSDDPATAPFLALDPDADETEGDDEDGAA